MNCTTRHRLRRIGLGIAAAALLSPPAQAIDLLQAWQLAIKNDASYQASVYGAAASREALPQAIAQLLPNISGSGSRSKNGTDSATPGLLGTERHQHSDYFSSNYALSLRQPIYRKYNVAQYYQAKSTVAGADATLERDRQELLVRLCNAYFEALLANDHYALVQSQKAAYAEQLKSARRQFEHGVGTRTDVDDAQARYDMTLAQELETGKVMAQKKRLLAAMINEPVNTLARLDPKRLQLLAPDPADPEHWVKQGEAVNPELRALLANVEAARAEVDKANSGHYPTIDLVAQRSRSASASDNTINQRYLTKQVGIQFNIPIFAGGYNNSLQRQARAGLERAQQLHEARRREINSQIRLEFDSVNEGMMRIQALEQAERSADQALLSNQKGHLAGVRTTVDILNAQQQRMSTLRELAQARYQYLLARIRLKNLTGLLDESEIETLNRWLTNSDAATDAPPAGRPNA